ncbi:response regulator [Paenibacillus taichungensis]|uniref:response regulator transcription factor n=1 Tax=Paenibacillus TaxID=44249 RepID=UPI0007BF5C5E|nr:MULTISPECIES: response regulator [Paenibacillus]MEC0111314.1 response regulator [Paenibacillus taichungensis]MEC0198873.1 response regulator [Paenibacillus taichungensis]
MLRVLIAENEPWIRAAIVEMVESIGHGIEVVGEATNGLEAWFMIQQLWPTVLITDIMMPEMDGLELIQNIEEEKIPMATIIISGYDNFHYAQKAIRYGVTEYLLKPIQMELLKSTLLRTMEKLTAISEMNHHLIRIQTFFETVNELEPIVGMKKFSELLDAIFKLKTVNHGAYLSFLRIVQTQLSDLWTATTGISRELINDFKSMNDQMIRRHLSQMLESWFLQPDLNRKEHRQLVTRACEYIQSHYKDDISLMEMAAYSAVSVSHFSLLFKQYTGESLVSYINNVRIEKAKKLLLNTNDKVYMIAENTGFSSQPYFIRVFKSLTGMTPSEYRKRMGG